MAMLDNLLQHGLLWLQRSRRKLATCGVGLVACVLAWHVVFGANGLFVYQQKRREYSQLQQQIQSLQQQNQQLDKQIKALKTDPQAIEKEAREQLRYVRENERVFTLPAKPVGTSATARK